MNLRTQLRIWAGAQVLCLLVGCDSAFVENNAPEWDGQTLFEALPPQVSGVEFANTLDFDEDFNIYTYRNFYNGGGVALGDVNNDGLTDIYLSGNRVANRLFLNRGDMRFDDVTDRAGVAGQAAWSTGVTMADVNADGWLDIYVCNSGDIQGDNRRNELYINQQDGTFVEAAEDYGLANEGLSTHGVFFDYDRDGDLDFYLLNNSYQAIGSFNLEKNERRLSRLRTWLRLLFRAADARLSRPVAGAGFRDQAYREAVDPRPVARRTGEARL